MTVGSALGRLLSSSGHDRLPAYSTDGSGARRAAAERARAPGDHVPVLDGLRGVAVLLVLFHHTIGRPLGPATTLVDAAVAAVATPGWTGVDLFFVLSGFLITGILLDTKGQPRWWPNFIVRRALRIFPLYYGALTVLFVLLPRLVTWSNWADFTTLQANQRWYWTYAVNLLAALTNGSGTPFNTVHFWSLSIEEQFYLMWPLVVWACTPRALLRVVAFAVIGGLAVRLGLVLQGSIGPYSIYFLTPLRLDGLMTGAALAVVARTPGGFAPLKALAPQVFGAGMLALGAVAMWRGGLEPRDPVVAVVAYPVIALVFGALLVMALTAPPTSRLVRTLCTASLGKWGKYSYCIYLIHYPLWGAVAWKTPFYRHEVALLGGSRLPSVLLIAVVVMSMSYTLAWLSYHLYEKHFLELKRYFVHRPASVPRHSPPEGATATAPLPAARPTAAAT